ncbi:unnamed protein product [Arabidopsis halleri]
MCRVIMCMNVLDVCIGCKHSVKRQMLKIANPNAAKSVSCTKTKYKKHSFATLLETLRQNRRKKHLGETHEALNQNIKTLGP